MYTATDDFYHHIWPVDVSGDEDGQGWGSVGSTSGGDAVHIPTYNGEDKIHASLSELTDEEPTVDTAPYIPEAGREREGCGAGWTPVPGSLRDLNAEHAALARHTHSANQYVVVGGKEPPRRQRAQSGSDDAVDVVRVVGQEGQGGSDGGSDLQLASDLPGDLPAGGVVKTDTAAAPRE